MGMPLTHYFINTMVSEFDISIGIAFTTVDFTILKPGYMLYTMIEKFAKVVFITY